jgi:hypothetical protein
MRKMSNIILPALALVFGLGIAGAAAVHAANTTTGDAPMGNLVSAIASKFNLNQADVQQVFDEQHTQMQAHHQQQFVDRISQAITAGKITQEQADKIIAKQKELQALHELVQTDIANMTMEQQRALMQEHKEQLMQWAKDNNIPTQYLHFLFGHGHDGHGMMKAGLDQQ